MRMQHLRRVLFSIGLSAGLALGVIWLIGQAALPAQPAAAQEPAALLTTVTADGALRVLHGDGWSVLAQDVGRGATVTGLAWHPTHPEVLLVRRTFTGTDPVEPLYSLVYLDLATGREQAILAGVGPQAEIIGPQIAPDGKSGFARLECCLSREIISFVLPLTGAPAKQGPAGAFLAPEAREVALVTTGAYLPDGRILMSAECCMGDEPAANPRGLYRVSADLTTGTRISDRINGLPLGVGPGGAWVAVLEQAPMTEDGHNPGTQLVIVDLPSGTPRPPLGEGGMRLAQAGAVAPNGTIVVAALAPGDELWQPYGALFRFTAAGAISPVPETDGGGVTAFGWASAGSVAAARKSASMVEPQEVSKAGPGSDFPHDVLVYFSKRPESDEDFTAIFPAMRKVGDAGVAYGALEELLRGPTPEEQAAGYFSEIGANLVGESNCNGEPFTLRIEAGTATLRFCRMLTSAGIGQDARMNAALKATLLQFSTIQRVRLLTPDGDCLFDESGENRCLLTP